MKAGRHGQDGSIAQKSLFCLVAWIIWIIAWIPLGLVFPFQGHGGVPGWYAPMIGVFAIPEIFKPESEFSTGRAGLFYSFILPFFIFWIGFILLPVIAWKVTQKKGRKNSLSQHENASGRSG